MSQTKPVDIDYITLYPISQGPDGYIVRVGQGGIVNLNEEGTNLAGWEMMEKDRFADIDAVNAGPELDALVALHVMGYGQVAGKFSDWITPSGRRYTNAELPEFSSVNRVWFREVEAEIERRGLAAEYISALKNIVVTGRTRSEYWLTVNAGVHALWLFTTATPDQRCRAALRAVMGG